MYNPKILHNCRIYNKEFIGIEIIKYFQVVDIQSIMKFGFVAYVV